MKKQDTDDDKSEGRILRATIRTNIIKYVTKVILKEYNHVVQDSQLQTAADVINNMTFYMDDVRVAFLEGYSILTVVTVDRQLYVIGWR